METVFNYCSEKAFFSSDEKKWINRIKKLIEEHPEDMRVIRLPENNDGCIYVELPPSWLKVQPPRKVEMTDERREQLSRRLAEVRAKKKALSEL